MEIWPLNAIVARCYPATAVWLALLEFANETGKAQFSIQREDLARRSYVHRMGTVSRALSTLEEAGWISRSYRYYGKNRKSMIVTINKPWKFVPRKKRRPSNRIKEINP